MPTRCTNSHTDTAPPGPPGRSKETCPSMKREARNNRKDSEACKIARKHVEHPKLSNDCVFPFFGVQEAPRWMPKPLKKQVVSSSAAQSFQNHPRSGEESRRTPQESHKSGSTAHQGGPRAAKSGRKERPKSTPRAPRQALENTKSAPRAPRRKNARTHTHTQPRQGRQDPQKKLV